MGKGPLFYLIRVAIASLVIILAFSLPRSSELLFVLLVIAFLALGLLSYLSSRIFKSIKNENIKIVAIAIFLSFVISSIFSLLDNSCYTYGCGFAKIMTAVLFIVFLALGTLSYISLKIFKAIKNRDVKILGTSSRLAITMALTTLFMYFIYPFIYSYTPNTTTTIIYSSLSQPTNTLNTSSILMETFNPIISLPAPTKRPNVCLSDQQTDCGFQYIAESRIYFNAPFGGYLVLNSTNATNANIFNNTIDVININGSINQSGNEYYFSTYSISRGFECILPLYSGNVNVSIYSSGTTKQTPPFVLHMAYFGYKKESAQNSTTIVTPNAIAISTPLAGLIEVKADSNISGLTPWFYYSEYNSTDKMKCSYETDLLNHSSDIITSGYPIFVPVLNGNIVIHFSDAGGGTALPSIAPHLNLSVQYITYVH